MHANTLPLRGESKRAASSRPSTQGVLSSSWRSFRGLQKEARGMLPKDHPKLGDLIAIDGSLLDATLSMAWADYRKGAKKAKVHMGFNLNQGVPFGIFLTGGKKRRASLRRSSRRLWQKARQRLLTGDTGATRNSPCMAKEDGIHFICRIRANTQKEVIEFHEVGGIVIFYDALVYCAALPASIGQKNRSRIRVGYRIDGKDYW